MSQWFASAKTRNASLQWSWPVNSVNSVNWTKSWGLQWLQHVKATELRSVGIAQIFNSLMKTQTYGRLHSSAPLARQQLIYECRNFLSLGCHSACGSLGCHTPKRVSLCFALLWFALRLFCVASAWWTEYMTQQFCWLMLDALTGLLHSQPVQYYVSAGEKQLYRLNSSPTREETLSISAFTVFGHPKVS